MIAVVERMDIFVTGIASAGCVATGASHKCQTGGNSRWAPSSDRFGLRGAERERPLLIFVTVSNGHFAEYHERLLTGVELDNRKAARRVRLLCVFNGY